MAFSRKQRNAIPVIVKQIAAINRRKADYSGYFGTPEGIRTPDTRLRSSLRNVVASGSIILTVAFNSGNTGKSLCSFWKLIN